MDEYLRIKEDAFNFIQYNFKVDKDIADDIAETIASKYCEDDFEDNSQALFDIFNEGVYQYIKEDTLYALENTDYYGEKPIEEIADEVAKQWVYQGGNYSDIGTHWNNIKHIINNVIEKSFDDYDER